MNKTNEIEVFAKTIYGMARNDSVKTMEAVASVIMNRLKKVNKNIINVCMDSQIFSCWNPQNYEYFLINNIPPNDSVFAICKRISLKTLHSVVGDTTNGATRFHDIFDYPFWARGKAPCLEIELKLFYNDVD